MKRIGLIALVALLTACTAAGAGQCNATLTGRPTDNDMGNGVHCYTFTQGSISCLQLR